MSCGSLLRRRPRHACAPAKASHILFPLDGFSENDALLVPKTEDGRVIFAVPWNGRLLVGTTDTGYTPGEEMVVTREEIEYLLRQLNPYLSSPLRADQVVSGYAGVRPLVAAQGVKETKKLIRDDEVEFDAESGIDQHPRRQVDDAPPDGTRKPSTKFRSIWEGSTPARTPDHPLSGSADYQLGLLADACHASSICRLRPRSTWPISTERGRRPFSSWRIPIRRSRSRWWKAKRPFALKWCMPCATRWR